MEEIKQSLGVHPRMPNWETHHMGTGQSLVSPSAPANRSCVRAYVIDVNLRMNVQGQLLLLGLWTVRFETPCTVSILSLAAALGPSGFPWSNSRLLSAGNLCGCPCRGWLSGVLLGTEGDSHLV